MNTLRLPEARRALAAAALLCLCAAPATATTMMKMDTAALTRTADRVVHARATGQRVYWNADGTQILTDTTFQVIDEAKGSGPATLTVSMLGGRIDPVEMSAAGTPTFKVGEEVVLFTTPGTNGTKNLAGYAQGVLHVQIDAATGRKVAFSRLGGATLMESSGGRLRQVGATPVQLELGTLMEEIRSIAGGAPVTDRSRPKTVPTRELPTGGNN